MFLFSASHGVLSQSVVSTVGPFSLSLIRLKNPRTRSEKEKPVSLNQKRNSLQAPDTDPEKFLRQELNTVLKSPGPPMSNSQLLTGRTGLAGGGGGRTPGCTRLGFLLILGLLDTRLSLDILDLVNKNVDVLVILILCLF